VTGPLRHLRRPGSVGRAVLGVLVLALAGCSGAVEVTAPAGADTPACTAAAAHWPAAVSGLARRDTTSTSPAVAAWGDPAVIARCGLDAPAPTTDPCLEVDGIGWVQVALSDGKRFTTFGTDPAIEVLIPNAYSPEGSLLPVFTAAARALPSTGHHCT